MIRKCLFFPMVPPSKFPVYGHSRESGEPEASIFQVPHHTGVGPLLEVQTCSSLGESNASQLGDIAGKSLEILREVTPSVRRVALVWDPKIERMGSSCSAAGRSQQPSCPQRLSSYS
jgi:hypothetical protein